MTGVERRKRVLFVCVENCNRSQMAEALARLYGAGQVEAFSAGCRPAASVHPKAIAAMWELGYDLTRHRAKVREDWNVPCPKAMPPEQFRRVRDLIGEKVKALLARL